MTHDELVDRAIKWLRRQCSARRPDGSRWYKSGCGVVVPELVSVAGEQPDAIGWCAGGYSYLVECKASRGDFLADRRKPRHRGGPGVGAECFYLCPPGLISADEVPEGWGLLSCLPKMIRVERAPSHNPCRHTAGELAMMYSLLRRVEVRGNLKACLAPKWGGSEALNPGESQPSQR